MGYGHDFETPDDPFARWTESELEPLYEDGMPYYTMDSETGEFSGAIKVLCNYDIRNEVMQAFLGGAEPLSGGRTRVKRPWLMEALDTDWPKAIALRAHIRPHGTQSPTAVAANLEYEKAEIVIEFGYREYDEGQATTTGLFMSEEWTPSAEFLTVDSGGLFWLPDSQSPLSATQAPGKILRFGSWVITHWWLSELPGVIDSWAGACNETAHKSPKYGLTFGEQTLQMASPLRERVMTATGYHAWNLALVLAVKPEGWNKFHRKPEGSAQLVSGPVYGADSEEVEFYPPINMEALVPDASGSLG